VISVSTVREVVENELRPIRAFNTETSSYFGHLTSTSAQKHMLQKTVPHHIIEVEKVLASQLICMGYRKYFVVRPVL
jgi:hypothetical protein